MLRRVLGDATQVSKRMAGFAPIAVSKATVTLPARNRFSKPETVPVASLCLTNAGKQGPMGELRALTGQCSAKADGLVELALLMGLKSEDYSPEFADMIEGLRMAEKAYNADPTAYRTEAKLADDWLPIDKSKRFAEK